MVYFILGFSISLNLFLIILFIFLFKKTNISNNLIEKVDETQEKLKEKNDPWIHSM